MITRNKADGRITVKTNNGDFDLEYFMSAAWEPSTGDGWSSPRIPEHWELDDPEPDTVIFTDRKGRQRVKPVKRGSLLYRLLCNWLDAAEFQSLCDGCTVPE